MTYTMLFLAFVCSSCNDWLDVTPKTEKAEEDAFKTSKGFQDALTACYIKMNDATLYGAKLMMTDIEYLAQHWSFDESNNLNAVDMQNFEYTSDYPKSTLKSIYSNLYNVITQANTVLENARTRGDVITKDDVRAVVEAEALGIRAFCHMDVLRLFGQMPQNGTRKVQLAYAEEVTTGSIPFYGFEDFTRLISRDIDAALALLKDHDPVFKYSFAELDDFTNSKNNVDLQDDFLGYRRLRFNYYALKALKARLYMYLGDKSKAYEEAKGVIDALDRNGNKMLTLAGESDFAKGNYALPSECILALSNYDLETNLKAWFNNGTKGLYLAAERYNNLFSGVSSGSNRKKVWSAARDNKHAEFLKYKQPEDAASMETSELATQKQVIPLIRLSEMYLIAMESATSLTEVNALYREYMAARGIDTAALTEEQVMQEIMQEYHREFFGEGMMFYTYKRWGTPRMLWKTDREVGENDYVAPLPDTELKTN